MSLQRRTPAVVLGCALVARVPMRRSRGAPGPPRSPRAGSRTLIAVGDIASCSSDGDEQTAALVSKLPGTIAVLGDIAYQNGSAQDFANCFDPSWGRLVPRIRAALGNHEYNTGTASVAIDLFGLPPNGWYSYSLGAWHVIVLNSNCSRVGGCERASPQWRWLQADLAAHPSRCTLAYWHHPRFSSGLHGSDAAYAPFWDLLARAKADVVLAGSRPRLRALRAGEGDPVVRRRHRWREPLPHPVAARRAASCATAARSACSGSRSGLPATTGSSCPFAAARSATPAPRAAA